jgi:sialate O-acetylesterase
MKARKSQTVFFIILLVNVTFAAVEPAGVFSDSMVLQRNMPVNIWGWAAIGEQVTIVFNGQTVQATSRDSTLTAYKGYWKATLTAMPAGGPYDMTISGSISTTPIILKNLLVGDVWICSGQSNMTYSMDGIFLGDNSQEVQMLPPDGQPITNMRLCQIGVSWSTSPVLDIQKTTEWPTAWDQRISAPWRSLSRTNGKTFNCAPGVIFGLTLYRQYSIPIGILVAGRGGTDMIQWTTPELGDSIEIRQCGNQPNYVVQQRVPVRFTQGQANSSTNGSLFAGMINPLLNMGIKGVVWWQGENESGMWSPVCNFTSGGFSRLVRAWRSRWGLGNFPFLYVQIQQGVMKPESLLVDEVRDFQMQGLSEPYTGMAVCFDSCSGIHPQNKAVPGLRLALCARALAYGDNIEYMGPIYKSFSIEADKIRVQFANTSGGLVKKDYIIWFQESNNLI